MLGPRALPVAYWWTTSFHDGLEAGAVVAASVVVAAVAVAGAAGAAGGGVAAGAGRARAGAVAGSPWAAGLAVHQLAKSTFTLAQPEAARRAAATATVAAILARAIFRCTFIHPLSDASIP